jgi:hypothetical protein
MLLKYAFICLWYIVIFAYIAMLIYSWNNGHEK